MQGAVNPHHVAVVVIARLPRDADVQQRAVLRAELELVVEVLPHADTGFQSGGHAHRRFPYIVGEAFFELQHAAGGKTEDRAYLVGPDDVARGQLHRPAAEPRHLAADAQGLAFGVESSFGVDEAVVEKPKQAIEHQRRRQNKEKAL